MLSLSKWIILAPSFLGLRYREKVRIADDDCVLADRLNVLHWQELATAQVANHAPAHLVAPHSTPLVHENVTHLPDLLALLGDYLGTGDRMTWTLRTMSGCVTRAAASHTASSIGARRLSSSV